MLDDIEELGEFTEFDDLCCTFLSTCLEQCGIKYGLEPDGEIVIESGDIELGEKITALHGQILELVYNRELQ
jgi:hypothetical protein